PWRAPGDRACRRDPRRSPGWPALPVGELQLGKPRLELVARLARGHRQAGKIPLGVGEAAAHAQLRIAFGQHHQRHGFAGAGGAGDHAVAVAVARFEHDAGVVIAADQDVGHGSPFVGFGFDCSQSVRRAGSLSLPTARAMVSAFRRMVLLMRSARVVRSLRLAPLAAVFGLLAACAGTGGSKPPATVAALYTRLDQATQGYQTALQQVRAGNDAAGQQTLGQALDTLKSASVQCGSTAGCDPQRFFSAYDRMLRLKDGSFIGDETPDDEPQ